MNNIKKRLLAFIETLPYGQDKFETKCGLSRGYVNKLSDNMTAKTQAKIEKEYPELNMDWLLTGSGEMVGGYAPYDVGVAIKQIDARTKVTLSAIAELLARANGGAATVMLSELEKMVNDQLSA